MPDIIPIINCNLQWRQRQAIYAKQGEYGARKVKIFLYNGSNSYEVPDSGISAVFAYKRPDGFSDSYDTIDGVDAIALSPSDNSATVTLAQNVLAVPGTVECELQLLTSGAMIATFTFYIIVEASVAPGTEPSEQTTNPFVRSPADIGSGYAICSTAAATAAKTAQIDGYKLTIGGRVSIRFDNAVPANATLNISNTGAKDIYYHGSIVTGSLIGAGDLVTFVYNGVRYCVTAIDASQSGGGGTVTPAAVVAATGGMTDQQAADTRENIGAGTYSKPADGISIYDLKSDVQQSISRADNAVRFNSQTLTEMQKLQALVNLGVDTAVLYSNQTLNELQKNVARENIGAGTYSKPSGGIPSTDMSSAVRTSLGKADSAYQKPGSGIPDGDLAIYKTTISYSGSAWQSNHSLADIIDAYNYEKQLRFYTGNTQLTPIEFTGTYITLAEVYPSSGRAILRLFIITSSGVGMNEYPIGDAFKPTDVQVSGSTPTITAEDNHVYSCGEITSLTITDSAQNISFKVDFTSGSTATVINTPSGYKAPGGDLTAEANKEYELDVRNGKAVLTAFEAVSAGA